MVVAIIVVTYVAAIAPKEWKQYRLENNTVKYLYSWLHSVKDSKSLEETKRFRINNTQTQNPRLENILIFPHFTSRLWGWKSRSVFQKLLNLFHMKAWEEERKGWSPPTSALTMHYSPVGKHVLSFRAIHNRLLWKVSSVHWEQGYMAFREPSGCIIFTYSFTTTRTGCSCISCSVYEAIPITP